MSIHGRWWSIVAVVVVAACGGESASPPRDTTVTVPALSSAPAATTPTPTPTSIVTSSTPVATTVPAQDGDVDTVVENGTFLGFLTSVDATVARSSITYDRVEVDEISWLPGVLAMPDLTNENPKQRLVPVADDAAVILSCGGPLDLGPSGCADGDGVPGSLADLVRYLDIQPYSWTAARAGIRTSQPYPAVFELRVQNGAVTGIDQRTVMPETIAGFGVDLGPWIEPAIEPCCDEPGHGNPSLPFPAPGAVLPRTLYATDAYEAGWSPDRPDLLSLDLYRWVPNACVAAGSCDEGAVEVDRSVSMPFAVTLDADVFVHVMSYECGTVGTGLPDSYVGDGTAFAQLLADVRTDTERWLAAPVRAGVPVASGMTAAGSPFEPEPCSAEREAPDGEAVYHHRSGIDVLLQGLPITPTGELRSPTSVVPVYSLAVDGNDVLHLFSYVGFRS